MQAYCGLGIAGEIIAMAPTPNTSLTTHGTSNTAAEWHTNGATPCPNAARGTRIIPAISPPLGQMSSYPSPDAHKDPRSTNQECVVLIGGRADGRSHPRRRALNLARLTHDAARLNARKRRRCTACARTSSTCKCSCPLRAPAVARAVVSVVVALVLALVVVAVVVLAVLAGVVGRLLLGVLLVADSSPWPPCKEPPTLVLSGRASADLRSKRSAPLPGTPKGPTPPPEQEDSNTCGPPPEYPCGRLGPAHKAAHLSYSCALTGDPNLSSGWHRRTSPGIRGTPFRLRLRRLS